MCLVDSRGKCPFRVKLRNTQTEHRVISGHSVMSELCPLYPRKRTCAVQFGMSASCQKRTLLVDYLIGSREKGCGYSEAENPSRLSIDNQF